MKERMQAGKERVQAVGERVRGVGVWLRYLPETTLAKIARKTGHTEGFWVVMLMSVVVGGVSAVAAVLLAQDYKKRR